MSRGTRQSSGVFDKLTSQEEKPAVAGELHDPLRPSLKSDSELKTGFRAAGLCRTKNGWAVGVVEIGPDGKLISVGFSDSQSFPDPVVGRLKKQQMVLNQEALNKNPWRPGGG